MLNSQNPVTWLVKHERLKLQLGNAIRDYSDLDMEDLIYEELSKPFPKRILIMLNLITSTPNGVFDLTYKYLLIHSKGMYFLQEPFLPTPF